MTQPPNQIGDPAEFIELAARAMPHTFAEWASEGEWRTASHLSLISKEIALAIAAGNGRIIVNLPPGAGKSFLISKWLPIWFLDNWPKKKIIMCSYGEELATRNGRWVRDEFASNLKLITKLREDVKAVGTFYTMQKGMMISTGLGGGVVGHRADLFIVDDPIKDHAEAYSALKRKGLVDAFEANVMSRLEPFATVIVLMQRWHYDDLCGYLMRSSGYKWKMICIPYKATANDPLGRKPGERLWTERYPYDLTEGKRKQDVEAMYQQNPPSELGERVYSNFSESVHVKANIKLQNDLPLGITLDFNTNPGVHLEIVQYDPQRDMINFFKEIHSEGMKTLEAIQTFCKWVVASGGWRWPSLRVTGDRSGNSENTTTSETDYSIIRNELEELKKKYPQMKYLFCIPLANPRRKYRLDTVQDALQDPKGESHVSISPQCTKLILDFGTQPKDEDGLPSKELEKIELGGIGHAGDAGGYFTVMTRPIRKTNKEVSRAIY